VVALAIMFKETDGIIRQTDWYKAKHSYKANVIAYSMSVLFDYIRNKCKGYEMDFMRIWNLQGLYPELRMQMKTLCAEVYEYITREDRLTENVTQWCKQSRCWELAQKKHWTILPEFLKTLISNVTVKGEEKEAKVSRKVENELDALKFIIAAGAEYWKKVLEWGNSRRLLSDMEIAIVKMVINMNMTGRVPSDKQAKTLLKSRERLIAEGMPLQFNT
jgi:hypothetical protein